MNFEYEAIIQIYKMNKYIEEITLDLSKFFGHFFIESHS